MIYIKNKLRIEIRLLLISETVVVQFFVAVSLSM